MVWMDVYAVCLSPATLAAGPGPMGCRVVRAQGDQKWLAPSNIYKGRPTSYTKHLENHIGLLLDNILIFCYTSAS
jgi:hypothetical protein